MSFYFNLTGYIYIFIYIVYSKIKLIFTEEKIKA